MINQKWLFVMMLSLWLGNGSITADPTFFFTKTKVSGWSLSKEFLTLLTHLFHQDIFVESGTSLGFTANEASNLFNEVHTIELDEVLYKKACVRFANKPSVHLYQGDSGDVLGAILPAIKERKLLLWLDGHFSGGSTAQGISNTPIMQELQAIKDNGITDAVILIDDVCCFHPAMDNIPEVAHDYPTINEVREKLLTINPAYIFVVYGDIAMAWPASYQIEISPLVKALTVSRLFDERHDAYDALFEAEATIATKATKEELEALWDMCTWHFDWYRAYSYFWYSLALMQYKRYGEAVENLLTVIESGLTHWRVMWYCALCQLLTDKNPESIIACMNEHTPNLCAALRFKELLDQQS